MNNRKVGYLLEDGIFRKNNKKGYPVKYVKKICKFCNKEFDARFHNIKNGNGNFCSKSCKTKYFNKKRSEERKKEAFKNPLQWNKDLAYLVGLIVSDGCLIKNRPSINFCNNEIELINYVKEIVKNKITHKENKIGKNKNTYQYRFTSRKFYYFLKNIGVYPQKSLTIHELDIPDKYFWHFLRGEIDGDGSFIKNNNFYNLEIYSGSKLFLKYINKKINTFLFIDKNINKASGCYKLSYNLEDTVKIVPKLYNNTKYYLTRKKDRAFYTINYYYKKGG